MITDVERTQMDASIDSGLITQYDEPYTTNQPLATHSNQRDISLAHSYETTLSRVQPKNASKFLQMRSMTNFEQASLGPRRLKLKKKLGAMFDPDDEIGGGHELR